MDISNLTLPELKALAYDLLIKRDGLTRDLQVIEQQIQRLGSEQEPLPDENVPAQKSDSKAK